MKISTKYFTLITLLLMGLGSYAQAEAPKELPTSKKQDTKSEELLPMKLEVAKSSSNPELKKGKGCADIKGLKEAKGETFEDYPIAKTVSCEDVDCKDLESAKLTNNNYKELPTAPTEVGCEEE